MPLPNPSSEVIPHKSWEPCQAMAGLVYVLIIVLVIVVVLLLLVVVLINVKVVLLCIRTCLLESVWKLFTRGCS